MEVNQIKEYIESISLPGEKWVTFKASSYSIDSYILWHISNKGRVAKNKKIYYGKLHKDGYMYLGNMKSIHRLVAEAFLPKTQEDILLGRNYIDHIDGNRRNNCVENLRWCTIKENNAFPLARLHASIGKKGSKNVMYHKPAYNRNKVLFNNGIICKYFYPDTAPEGFVVGRLKRENPS